MIHFERKEYLMYDLTSSIKTLFNDTVKYNIGYALYT